MMKEVGLGLLVLSGVLLYRSGLDVTGSERKRAFGFGALGTFLVWKGTR